MRLPFPASHLTPVAVPADRLPRPCKLEGAFAPNTVLRLSTRLFEHQIVGSESVAVAPDGRLWMLDRWGWAFTATADAEAPGGYCLNPEPVAYVGPGRPLGFHFNAAGDTLVICDSLKGLMALERSASAGTGSSSSSSGGGTPQWRLRCLANSAGGQPINYANDLDLAADGTIYFSDSSLIPPALNDVPPRPWYDTMRSYLLTMFHGGATGRLLAHIPSTGTTRVLAEGLWYANGVALAHDEAFVAVVETASMRVRRYWLKGPKAGTLDTLIDRLPGFPDNIVRADDGKNFWLCLVAPDMPLVHRVLPSPTLRGMIANLPDWLQPNKPQWGCVVKVSPEGEVLQVLMDPDGSRVSHVSSVTEHAGKLFIGNLAKDYVSVLELSQIESGAAAGSGAAAAAGCGQ